MKKLPDYLDNQYDNVLTNIVSNTVDIFYKVGFNPNGITTLSLIFGLLSIYLLRNNKYIEAAVCYLISYFFDCMDGYMARKYNLTTNFGDYYDHIKDMIVFILLSYVIFIKFKRVDSNLKYLPLIIFPFLLTTGVHFGCQEIYYNNEVAADSLNFTKNYCPAKNKQDAEKVLLYTKYFSSGTLIVITCLVIASCKFLNIN